MNPMFLTSNPWAAIATPNIAVENSLSTWVSDWIGVIEDCTFSKKISKFSIDVTKWLENVVIPGPNVTNFSNIARGPVGCCSSPLTQLANLLPIAPTAFPIPPAAAPTPAPTPNTARAPPRAVIAPAIASTSPAEPDFSTIIPSVLPIESNTPMIVSPTTSAIDTNAPATVSTIGANASIIPIIVFPITSANCTNPFTSISITGTTIAAIPSNIDLNILPNGSSAGAIILIAAAKPINANVIAANPIRAAGFANDANPPDNPFKNPPSPFPITFNAVPIPFDIPDIKPPIPLPIDFIAPPKPDAIDLIAPPNPCPIDLIPLPNVFKNPPLLDAVLVVVLPRLSRFFPIPNIPPPNNFNNGNTNFNPIKAAPNTTIFLPSPPALPASSPLSPASLSPIQSNAGFIISYAFITASLTTPNPSFIPSIKLIIDGLFAVNQSPILSNAVCTFSIPPFSIFIPPSFIHFIKPWAKGINNWPTFIPIFANWPFSTSIDVFIWLVVFCWFKAACNPFLSILDKSLPEAIKAWAASKSFPFKSPSFFWILCWLIISPIGIPAALERASCW